MLYILHLVSLSPLSLTLQPATELWAQRIRAVSMASMATGSQTTRCADHVTAPAGRCGFSRGHSCWPGVTGSLRQEACVGSGVYVFSSFWVSSRWGWQAWGDQALHSVADVTGSMWLAAYTLIGVFFFVIVGMAGVAAVESAILGWCQEQSHRFALRWGCNGLEWTGSGCTGSHEGGKRAGRSIALGTVLSTVCSCGVLAEPRQRMAVVCPLSCHLRLGQCEYGASMPAARPAGSDTARRLCDIGICLACTAQLSACCRKMQHRISYYQSQALHTSRRVARVL